MDTAVFLELFEGSSWDHVVEFVGHQLDVKGGYFGNEHPVNKEQDGKQNLETCIENESPINAKTEGMTG